MALIVPVILAGGAGTRLWPVSRETMPKHLAKLIGDESLLQLTANRLLALAPAARLVTVASDAQDLLIKRQLLALDPNLAQHRLLEPTGRNTAAAIALAALHVRREFGADAVLWVCPSDHLIQNQPALEQAVHDASPIAEGGDLVTFGIKPTRPETGYGYIKAGMPIGSTSKVLRVDRFVEKPDLATAKAMIKAGGYYWNSGMFLFRTDQILSELATHEPAILEATEEAFNAATANDDGSIAFPLSLYKKIPSAPIDKAVMERAEDIAVVPCNPDWTDLGSWHSIWEQSTRDEQGNATYGDVLLNDAENCLVHTSHRLVACAGVKDLAIIETDDALLVTDRGRSEPVKEVVASLNAAHRSEAVQHSTIEQNWGSYSTLEETADAQIQRLSVSPGKQIDQLEGADASLHWLVINGTAEFRLGDQQTQCQAGQSADLPAHTPYSIANPTTSPLTLIQISAAPKG
ncbi:MAG: mannose-1-phosphate guanylyltransferase/mannose-6-phosphate isomerase [Geminicoccales bacterium]